MDAKAKAIEKALKGEDYSGYCVCGLFEYVRPVKISGKIRYIIYLGNILKDQDIARQKISAVVGKTGVSKDSLLKELLSAEPFSSQQEYLKILDLLEFHILRFHEESKQLPPHRNFIVNLLKDFIEKNYDKNFSILDFAKTHRVNAKYLGRLYKTQEGVTVTEHLNAFRLEKAAKQLKNTDTKIIEIALSVGFSNIGYFNRIFKNKFGVTPKEYRANN
jgi:YesN/AraC family two-component response regulator